MLTGERVQQQAERHKSGPVLVFPSAIGDGRYLNFAVSEARETLESVQKTGWKEGRRGTFFIFKYTLTDDVLKYYCESDLA